MTPSLAVIISTLGRPQELERVLSRIAGCNPLPDEVIVVDGDASGSARPVVEAVLPWARWIPPPPGLTRQRNAGLAAVRSEVVLFLDDDVEFGDDVFARLAALYQDPSLAGATGKVVNREERKIGGSRSVVRRFLPGGGKEGGFTSYGYPRRIRHSDRTLLVEFMPGCFMSARTEYARKVGFDENLTGYGLAEDEDFSYRLSRLGPILYCPEIEVVHENLGFGSAYPRAFSRLVVVNRAYLFAKNFRRGKKDELGFLVLIIVLLGHRLLNRDWSGARGIIEGSLEARTRGWLCSG